MYRFSSEFIQIEFSKNNNVKITQDEKNEKYQQKNHYLSKRFLPSTCFFVLFYLRKSGTSIIYYYFFVFLELLRIIVPALAACVPELGQLSLSLAATIDDLFLFSVYRISNRTTSTYVYSSAHAVSYTNVPGT